MNIPRCFPQLLLSLTLIACTASGNPIAAVLATECPATPIDTRGWQKAGEKEFFFELPSGFDKTGVQGVWKESNSRVVTYEYSGSSSTLNDVANALDNESECSITTGGLRARVISGFDSHGSWSNSFAKYVVAASWRDVKPGVHLTMTATGESTQRLPELFAIMRSVRFE